MLTACAALGGVFLIGILTGYDRAFNNIIMRVTDGLMSIPIGIGSSWREDRRRARTDTSHS